jgi:DNA-binding NarL/FixJ family response regulator
VPRVLIADNSLAVMHAIRFLLEQASDIEVVAEASDFREALKQTAKHRPDAIIIGMNLKDGGDEPTALAKLASECQCPIIATSFAADDRARQLSDKLGAARLLDKTELSETLIPAIREVVRG